MSPSNFQNRVKNRVGRTTVENRALSQPESGNAGQFLKESSEPSPQFHLPFSKSLSERKEIKMNFQSRCYGSTTLSLQRGCDLFFPCEDFDGKDSHLKCWQQFWGHFPINSESRREELWDSRGSDSEWRGEQRVGPQIRNHGYLIKWEK